MDLHADHSERVVVDATATLQGQGAVSLERQGQGDHAQITVLAHPAGDAGRTRASSFASSWCSKAPS